ncbi:acetylcholine receptor subunit alpha-like isoform X3 [Choristoneura fumiferana]|uniref:acetylcholine receptor subunit alpha-like isoform X3 n=1 Tax=Choristoneura fumiferana TaxID=7141 RepID=UPI003D15BB76
MVAGGLLPRARRLRRQPGRQAALRRPAVQLQQAGAARRKHHRRPPRLHQTQAQPAHRRQSEKSDHDNEPVGGAVVVRLQASLGTQGVRWRPHVARAFRPHLAARHRALQQVDLRHMDEQAGSNIVSVGVDLSEFYMSVEWDILEVPAVRNEKFYTCCDEPYLDITFNITMRRKTLFYTVNIIIPCMGISFLTVLTFYLPSDSGEKVTLSISILISLHVFFLLVVEIIPPTSLVVPLLGKYLIFAMILVSISICVTVVVLNVHFRSPQTHRMAPWVKRVFIHILPRLLFMKRPQYKFDTTRSRYTACGVVVRCGGAARPLYPYRLAAAEDDCCAPGAWPPPAPLAHPRPLTRTPSKEDLTHTTYLNSGMSDSNRFGGSCVVHGSSEGGALGAAAEEELSPVPDPPPGFSHSSCPPEVHRTCFCVRFIAEHTRMLEDSTKVKEDWKYVAMVLDRLFLWIFTLAVLVGTAGIILQAPTLYDDRVPIDKHFNQIATSTLVRCPPPA